jgi:hypothetical protein
MSISLCGSITMPVMLVEGRRNTLVPHLSQHNTYYLTAYLGAVTGCLRQRGTAIYAAELMPSPQSLNCSITFCPPRQHAGFTVPAWVAYYAGWNEHRGWCCELHHIVNQRSRVRRYLKKPLVPAPDVVADFIVESTRGQTLGTLSAAEPGAHDRLTTQELADDLIRFTPSCTWLG